MVPGCSTSLLSTLWSTGSHAEITLIEHPLNCPFYHMKTPLFPEHPSFYLSLFMTEAVYTLSASATALSTVYLLDAFNQNITNAYRFSADASLGVTPLTLAGIVLCSLLLQH